MSSHSDEYSYKVGVPINQRRRLGDVVTLPGGHDELQRVTLRVHIGVDFGAVEWP